MKLNVWKWCDIVGYCVECRHVLFDSVDARLHNRCCRLYSFVNVSIPSAHQQTHSRHHRVILGKLFPHPACWPKSKQLIFWLSNLFCCEVGADVGASRSLLITGCRMNLNSRWMKLTQPQCKNSCNLIQYWKEAVMNESGKWEYKNVYTLFNTEVTECQKKKTKKASHQQFKAKWKKIIINNKKIPSRWCVASVAQIENQNNKTERIISD